MTRAARYLDRLYREYPVVWRRERDRADRLGIPLMTIVEVRANHWELMLKLHEEPKRMEERR